MIPFEELCEALARWRSKNGLQNGPSARPPQGFVTPPAVTMAAGASDGTAAQGGAAPHYAAPGFAPATTEETLAESQTTVAANPLAAHLHDDGEAPTGLHAPAPENTSELDLDNVVLVDEDDA